MEEKNIDNDYKTIPMSEITDEARIIAVRWAEANGFDWIGDKHKLASDIMNYARIYEIKEFEKFYDDTCEQHIMSESNPLTVKMILDAMKKKLEKIKSK